jgi:type VI secretion system protein ImpA
MPSVDINAILEPVTADAPCGVDLEAGNKHDPAFAELERLAQGKPEQQIGTTVVPAESPDWKVLQRKAIEVLARSKDLRAATHLARSLLQTDGWAGLAEGLEVLRGLIERYWEGLYPRLDPEDGNDPTMRINIMMSITDPAILSAVRGTPLVVSRSLGRFSLKDLEAATGDTGLESRGDPAGAMASIEAAAIDADLGALEAAVVALRACLTALAGLEVAIAAQVPSADSLSFTKLSALLRKAEGFLATRLAQRAPAPHFGGAPGRAANGAGTGADIDGGMEVDMGSGSAVGGDRQNGAGLGSAAGHGGGVAGWSGGGIRSREDVVRALDAITAYYERHEPSSPIPIFVARCKRLVTMGFVDIVRDLVPDALAQVDVLRGRVE